MSLSKNFFVIERKSADVKEARVAGFRDKREEGEVYEVGKLQRGHLFSLPYRIDFLLAVLCVFYLLTFFSLIKLQVAEGNEQFRLAENNRIRQHIILPVRGFIYDRFDTNLTKNVPSFSLQIIPSDFRADASLRAEIIASLIALYPDEEENITRIFREISSRPLHDVYVVRENIGYEEAMRLLVRSAEWQGVFIAQTNQRAYPSGEATSNIIGYIGLINEEEYRARNAKMKGAMSYRFNDYIGKTGIELFYEESLRGIPGAKKVEIDTHGNETKILSQTDPVQGDDIVLALDVHLQKKIIGVLTEAMKKRNVERAAAVALNPQNGDILALVSLPSYDNNLFAGGIRKSEYQNLISDGNTPLFNRSIQGEYPPGSTFKLVVGAAGLEEGVITEHTQVLSVGGIYAGKAFFPDWKQGGHGLVNIKQAIANSVNTFFYIAGGGLNDKPGLGLEKIGEYAHKFQLGLPSGIDLPSESQGFVPSAEWKLNALKERWYLGDTYHLSIGQGFLLVTPLQVALWTSYFAGGGVVYKPHLLKSKKVYTTYNQNPSVIDFQPEILYKDVISKKNAEIIKQGLLDAVRFGSAQILQSLPVKSGGKTGSAQFAEGEKPHGWFTAFAPYDNPTLVLTVLLEGSGGGQYVTEPVRDIMKWYFERG